MTAYLTPGQVSAELHTPLVTIQRWCRQGRFPGAVRVGRSWGIPPDAVARVERPGPAGNPEMRAGTFWTAKRRKSLSRTRKKLSRKSVNRD